MHFNKKKLSEICAAALIAGGATAVLTPVAALAATAAGTLIKNLATVTYEDANGNEYSAQSNEAVITVKQVYSAEIDSDREKTAAAGQTVYTQHTITNTGNGADTFDLTIADQLNGTDDDIDAEVGGLTMYLDENGNGLADAGEPAITSVTLAAGESASVVVAAQVPNSATPGQTLGSTLTVTSANGTPITDTGANGDGDDTTNQDMITVTQDAVLNYNKAAVIDEANNQINYTLTVTNTGNIAATDVKIYDAIPLGTTFVSASASGLLTGNTDDLPVNQTLDEATVTVDLNNDGDMIDTGVEALYAMDKELAPGATISVQFTVAYDPATFNNDANPGSAGDIIENMAHLLADVDGDPSTPPESVPSNPTQTELPQIFTNSVSADDTNTGAAPGTNDGGDDDATPGSPNDIQTVDEAADGSTVLFPVVLTNNSNGSDTLDLTIDPGTFPPGTTFTFWSPDGTVPLVDTNGESGPDTGVLDAGESATVMVKANLPSNAPTGNNFTATVTATSSEDPSGTPASDTTDLLLMEIVAPDVDLRDQSIPATTAANEDELAAAPYNVTGNPAYTTDAGTSVNIPFHIDNNSGSSDAFQLSAGSVSDGTDITAGLPTGWDVDFYKGDGSGNPLGQPLSNTELLPAGSTDNEYIAVISVPADQSQSLADFMADNDNDGTADTMDANNDGDGDQPIFIKIESANSGASDIMVDAVDVNPNRGIVISPPGANQIQPGGSVDYTNTLENTGNTDEPVELSGENSNPDWNNNIEVDTDGDGEPDTPLSQLVPGVDQIFGTDPDGTPVPMDITDADGDGNPEITVPPGVSIPLEPTVYAPADAPPGTVDILTITAESVDVDPIAGTVTPDSNGPTTMIEDTTEVIAGQVRLTKSVAYDAACDGAPDGAFEAELSDHIAPGECAIWQIVAENQGDADAMNVVINDEVTAFTTYEADSLAVSIGNGIVPTTGVITDTTGDDAGEISGDAITFYVGNAPDAANSTGGTLPPGEFATVWFSTKVD